MKEEQKIGLGFVGGSRYAEALTVEPEVSMRHEKHVLDRRVPAASIPVFVEPLKNDEHEEGAAFPNRENVEFNIGSPPESGTLSSKAKVNIESALRPRVFLYVIGGTMMLLLYIYNVIAINRLSSEITQWEDALQKAKSVTVELESTLRHAERGERISGEAYERLGLRFNPKPPVVIERH